MEAPRNFVAAGAKFAAGMEHGEHCFQGALTGAGMDICGDTPAVVANGAGAIGIKAYFDVAAVAG